MGKEMVITILLAALVIVSAVQAMQLGGLNSQIEGVSVSSLASETPKASSASASSGGTSLPSSLENLPGMVGGC